MDDYFREAVGSRQWAPDLTLRRGLSVNSMQALKMLSSRPALFTKAPPHPPLAAPTPRSLPEPTVASVITPVTECDFVLLHIFFIFYFCRQSPGTRQ